MHRHILGVNDSKVFVDHINHDTLDNRRSNLRIAGKNGNQRNARKTSKKKSSIYKGVSWQSSRNKWICSIRIPEYLFLGRFDCEKEAALVYNKAAKKYFGRFSCLNTIEQ